MASSKDPYVRFWIEDGIEVAMCTAADFRETMNERDRLRTALEKIADTEGNIHPSWHVQTAREALGKPKDG
jgi:hypothetical protein